VFWGITVYKYRCSGGEGESWKKNRALRALRTQMGEDVLTRFKARRKRKKKKNSAHENRNGEGGGIPESRE